MAYSEMTTSKPQFSIIMPLYNKEAYVEKAIGSVLCQSFKDWELIVVNDGSTDGSFDVAAKVIGCDSQCRILNQANAGVAAARNNGVAISNGEYLCFLDADDWWEPAFLEEMALFVKNFPDAGLYATNYFYYKPGKTHVAINNSTGYLNYPKTYYENGAMPVTSITVCLSRNVFDRSGGFPENIKLGEDFLVWSKIAVDNKVAFLNKPLAYYNNDIPSNLRATRNLHNPECHMLFNMEWLEDRVSCMEDNTYWKQLLDKLRVNGLMDYWLSKHYHQRAAEELKKVDWSQQPKSVVMEYKMPIPLLILKNKVMIIGSKIKRLFV